MNSEQIEALNLKPAEEDGLFRPKGNWLVTIGDLDYRDGKAPTQKFGGWPSGEPSSRNADWDHNGTVELSHENVKDAEAELNEKGKTGFLLDIDGANLLVLDFDYEPDEPDVDAGKWPDRDELIEHIESEFPGQTVWGSQNGGLQVPVLLTDEAFEQVYDNQWRPGPGVDSLKGPAAKGYTAAPLSPGYSVYRRGGMPLWGVEDLEERDEFREPPETRPTAEHFGHDTEFEVGDYDVDETEDIEVLAAAIRGLGPDDFGVPYDNVESIGGNEYYDPGPYRSSSSGRSLAYVAEKGWWWDYKHDRGMYADKLVALAMGLISSPLEKLEGADWWKAVERLRELGADVPEWTEDANTVPFVRYPAARNLLTPVATETPDTNEVRERLRRKILATARTGSNYVIDAPTSSGKTHQFSTMEWVGEIGVPAVHFHGSRDARDEAMEMSEEADVVAAKLQGRKEACPVAGGEHDHELSVNGEPASKFIDRVCDENGVPFSMAKGWLQQYNDQGRDTLPCREDGQCRAETQHNGIPFGEDSSPSVDVVHATHPFMHVPGYTTGTVVGIDEPPSFDLDIDLYTAVNAYLKTTRGGLESIADLIAAGDRELMSAASRMNDPGDEWFMLRDAHTAAPAAAEALATALVGGPDDNGRVHIGTEYKPPGSAVNQLSAVFDVHDREFRNVRSVPSLEYARAVVGLEENPSEHKWPRVTGLPNMQVDKVLGDKERRAWRRENRGLVVSQIGDSYRPLTKGTQYLDKDSLRLILGELQRVHGEDAKFGVITSKEAEGEVTRIASQELGSRPPTMHYGDTRSKNDFRDVDVLLAVGNIDPGDGYVLDMAAEYGLDAVPERDPSREHKACAGTGCRECGQTGNARKHGRGFDGRDSEKAEALLRDITHKEVAQALGRVARGDQGAFAYAWTNAVPERLVDHELPDPREITEKQRDVLEAVEGGATAPEAAREAGVSRQYARDILEEADEAARSKRAGPNGADYWRLAGGTLGSRDVWDPYTSQLPSSSAVSGQTRLMAAREPGGGGHNAEGGIYDGPSEADAALDLEDFGLVWADDEGIEKIYTPHEYMLTTGEDLRSLTD